MERIDCMLICCMSHATITKIKRTSVKSKIMRVTQKIFYQHCILLIYELHPNKNMLIFQEYHNHVRTISGKNIQHNYVVKIEIIV